MKKALSPWNILSITALTLGGMAYTGCGPGGDGSNDPKPEDAYSAAGQALPAGATEFTGTQADWEQLKSDGRFIPLSDRQNDADTKTAQQQDLDAQGTINAFLLLHPEMAGKIGNLVDPADLTDDFARRVNLRLQAGNYFQDLVLKNQETRTFSLLGDANKRMIVAGALKAFDDSNQVRTSAKIYGHLYDLMKADPHYARIIGGFKTPGEVDLITDYRTVKAEVAKFNAVFQFPFNLLPIDPRPAPNHEIGYGTGGDRTASSCTTPSATGVIGSSYNFPLKYYVTSVKEQGSRGSCVSFGVNGALETAWARDTGKYVNLSEQDLYYHMKGFWWPVGDAYGDGSDTHSVFDKMVALGGGYYVPYENQWDYNPSWSRTEDAEDCGKPGKAACTRTYTHSCDGYSESCSDRNHQGGLTCATYYGWNYCGFISPVTSTSQQVRAKGDAEIWDHTDVNKSFAYTLIALVLKSPVVVGLPVTKSFDDADANGYVTYVGPSEKNRGGHALEVVGFIDDGNLPVGAPPAGADGGGGYFIIKNSWGTCLGDTGFYYIPYQWMKDYAYSMVVLNGIEHK